MVDVIVPIRLSTPKFFIISIATAVDALPEIGRISIKGNTSEGILKIHKIGENHDGASQMDWNRAKKLSKTFTFSANP